MVGFPIWSSQSAQSTSVLDQSMSAMLQTWRKQCEPNVEVQCLVFPVAKVMEYYCPPCETAMCQECTSGEHGEHPTVPLKDVVEQHKASLQDQLDAVKKRYSSNTNTTKQQMMHFVPSSGHDAVKEAILYELALSCDCLPRVSLSLPGCQRSTRPCRRCQRSCSS